MQQAYARYCLTSAIKGISLIVRKGQDRDPIGICYSPLTRKGKKMTGEVRRSVLLERGFVYLFFLIMQVAVGQESPIGSNGGSSLQNVISCVRSNEEKLTLLKMTFLASWKREGRVPDYYYSDPRASRTDPNGGHQEIEWAQDGIRQRYVRRDFRDGRLTLNQISVVDGEVMKSGDWPELNRGAVRPAPEYSRWMANSVTQLFYRPCSMSPKDWPLLSEWLGSQSAGLPAVRRVSNGKDLFVVDTRSGTSGFRRFYIDCEMGLLMRLETYTGHPDDDQSTLVDLKEVTEVHQLSNGGWVPLEGRIVHYGDGVTVSTDVHVDVNSVSVDRDDIPDSLFRLDFPEHTRVTNTVVGYDVERIDRIATTALTELANTAMGDARNDGDKTEQPRTTPEDAKKTNDLSPRPAEPTREDSDQNGNLAYGVGRITRWLGLFLVAVGISAFVLMTLKKRAA